MRAIGNHTNIDIEIGLVRHMVLNSIRAINSKHRLKYGELIIATDTMRSWRKDVFPYYKANRKKIAAKRIVINEKKPFYRPLSHLMRQKTIKKLPGRLSQKKDYNYPILSRLLGRTASGLKEYDGTPVGLARPLEEGNLDLLSPSTSGEK